MRLAAVAGFLTGTFLVLWGFLRQHSTAAEPDPLDTVQTTDPYVFALTLDCE